MNLETSTKDKVSFIIKTNNIDQLNHNIYRINNFDAFLDEYYSHITKILQLSCMNKLFYILQQSCVNNYK